VGRKKAMDNCAEMIESELENCGLTEQLEQFKRLRGLTDRCTIVLEDLQPQLF